MDKPHNLLLKPKLTIEIPSVPKEGWSKDIISSDCFSNCFSPFSQEENLILIDEVVEDSGDCRKELENNKNKIIYEMERLLKTNTDIADRLVKLEKRILKLTQNNCDHHIASNLSNPNFSM
ncbi:hypothetical protein ABK040_008198 [Willaertia magna]